MLHLTRGANAGELGPQPKGLEPYADRRNQGCYYSPKAQVAHDQAEVKRARQARNNSLLASPGTAGPAVGSLAARITTTPVTGVAGPSTAPILGALPLVNPSVPLPAASTSMEVNYGSPLMDPPSEGNNHNASGRHEDLDAPVSM